MLPGSVLEAELWLDIARWVESMPPRLPHPLGLACRSPMSWGPSKSTEKR